MNFLERFRPFFLARTRREKILGALFLLIIAVIWLSLSVDRLKSTWSDARAASVEVQAQDQTLNVRASIEAQYARMIESIANIPRPTRLEAVAKLDELTASFPNKRIDPSSSAKQERLIFHTINVTLPNTTFNALASFQQSVLAAMPTVNLKTIELKRQQKPPTFPIDARFTFEAVEFTN